MKPTIQTEVGRRLLLQLFVESQKINPKPTPTKSSLVLS